MIDSTGGKIEEPFNFDLEKTKEAVESGGVSFPQGLSRGERREFIRKQVKAKPSGLTLREAFDIVYSENEKAFEELSKL